MRDNEPMQEEQRWQKTATPIEHAPRPSNKKRNIIIGVAALVSICLLAVVFLLINHSFRDSGMIVDKEHHLGKNNVIVLPIEGTIEAEGATYNQEHIDRVIQSAMYDLDNKGILLKINSPGGAVYESDATYYALEKYKEKTGRPVYAYCENMAASGGYYIAAAADKIYANRNSLVGSIGVIGTQVINAQELLDKVGIDLDAVYTGDNKLMGSPSKPLTEEQRKIFQRLSDEAYAQFTGIVAKSRGFDDAKVKKLADGRIYTAQQATNNGLIDGMVMPDKLEKIMKKDKRIGSDITFIERPYEPPLSFSQSLLGIEFKGSHSPMGEALAFLEKIEEENRLAPQYLYLG